MWAEPCGLSEVRVTSEDAGRSAESAEMVRIKSNIIRMMTRLTGNRLEENSHLLQPPINNFCVYDQDGITVMVPFPRFPPPLQSPI